VLLLTTALTGLPMQGVAQPAPTARPTGGQVVAGQASIAQTPARTTVNQASQRAAVDWKSFDVGSAHTVQFAQPGASAVTLNRVIGPNPSEIAGRIEANGQVVIVNQAGVLFHKGAQIDTAGLVATASGISNGNFMAGKMVFDQKANPGAKVENRGTITIRDRGLAALVAPQVANSGVVRATMGTVVLAGAEAHTLDLYGDGMVAINVTRQVQTAPDGTKALVTNTGTIEAQGGGVVLTAEAVDGVVQTLVNAGGVIRADGGNGSRAGRIIASGRGGDVILAGTMAADGSGPGGKGGTVVVNTTGRIALADGARVSASGPGGGGTIAIGTNTARTPDRPSVAGQPLARSVLVSPGVTVAADATVAGRGGIVTILSSGVTRMEGVITARGVSGGGFVEVSGGRVSSAAGRIDVSASEGPQGTILIDPDFLDIVAGASGSGTQDPFVSDGTILAGDASIPPDTVSTGVLNALSGNVMLQANKTITVNGDVTLTNTPGQSLVLEAGGTIVVAGGITITATGDVTLATGGAGPSSLPAAVADPLISVQGNIISNTGSVTLLAGAGGSITVGGVIEAGAVTLHGLAGITQTGVSRIGRNDALVTLQTNAGAVTQAASATLVAATLRAPDGVGGAVGLSGTSNAVANLGAFTVTGGGNSFTLINTGSLTISGPLTVPHNIGIATGGTGRVTVAGTIANSTGAMALIAGTGGIVLNAGAQVAVSRVGLTATGGISLAGGASLGLAGGLIDIGTTAGGVTQDAGAVMTTGTLRSTAGITGDTSLSGTANAIALLGDVTVNGGTLTLVNTGSLVVAGTVAAPAGEVSISTTGLLSVTGAVSATDVGLRGGSVDVTGAVGASAAGIASITADSGTLSQAGTVAGGSTVSLSGALGLTHAGTTSASAPGGEARLSSSAGDILNTGTVSAEIITVSATAPGATLRQQGSIVALASVVATVFDFEQTGGLTRAGDTVSVTAERAVSHTGGTIVQAGTASAAGILVTANGTAVADGLTIGAGAIIRAEGGGASIDLQSKARIEIAGRLDLSDTTSGGVALTSTGTGSAIALLTTGVIESGAGVSLFANHATGALDLAGTISAGAGGLSLTAGAGLTQSGGLASTTGDLTARAGLLGSGDLSVMGSLSAAGTLAMTASAGSIDLGAGAIAAAPSATLIASGSIGLVGGSSLGQTGALVDLSAGAGIIQDAGATLIAATLQSTTGITGGVTLAGTANAVATVGSLAVTGGDFRLLDAGTLAVTGKLTALGNVALTATGISASGTITAGSTLALAAGSGGIALNTGAVVTGPVIDLHGGAGGITIGSGASLGLPLALINLATSGGGITQDPLGIIRAATMQSDGIVGSVALDGLNTLAELGAMPVTGDGAGFRLAARGTNLRIVGTVSAPGTVAIDHSGTGTLTVARLVQAGTDLSVTGGDQGIAITGFGTLLGQSVLMQTPGPIMMAAGAIVGQVGALVDLNAAGVTQDAGATLLAGTLQSSSGINGQLDLLGSANAITALGSITVTDGALNLVNTTGLTIVGQVTSALTGLVGSPSLFALVTPPGVSIATEGPIVLAAGASLGGAGGTVDLSTTAGGIVQDAGAVIQAQLLTSSGGITGSATLAGTANAIETLGSFAVSGSGADLLLTNSITLGVTGPVSATRDIRLNATALSVDAPITAGATLVAAIAGAIDLNTGAVLAAPHIEVAAQGAVSLAAGVRLGQAGASVDLATGAGGITQDANATLIATTLTSTSGVTGDVALAGTANAVGTLAAFAVTGGGFGLVNAGSLVVAGPVTATGSVALTASGAVAITGGVTAGTALSILTAAGIDLGLAATAEGASVTWNAAGPITLGSASRLGRSGSVVDLTTTSGGMVQDAGGTIIAASLGAAGGITGDLTLIGSNAIAAIGDAVVSGSVRVFNQAALTLAGTLASGGNVYLRVTDPVGITIGSAGRLTSATTGRTGFHADAMRILAGGSVVTADFEYAPVTSGATLTLGTGVGGLDTLLGVSATLATIGAVSIPGTGETVTAGAIVTAAAFDANGLALRLLSLGRIEGTAAPLTNVASLTGSSGASTDLSHAGNAILALGDFTAAGTDADLRVATLTSLTVGGTIAATRDIALTSTGAMSVTGSIDASRDLTLGSGAAMTVGATLTAGRDGGLTSIGTMAAGGSIAVTRDLALNSGAALSLTDASVTAGGSLAAVAGGGIAMTRATVSAPSIRLSAADLVNLGTLTELGRTGALVDIATTAGGVTQDTSGRITALRLGSAAGITGDLSLASETNVIGTISAITASGGIDIVSLGTGVVSGILDAGTDLGLRYAADLTVAGTIQATGSVALTMGRLTVTSLGKVAGADLAFNAGGPIDLLAGAVVGQAGAMVRMDSTAGSITQDANGTLIAARLDAAATGSILLAGTANLIQTVGTLLAAAGDATLRNASALRVEGPVSASAAVDIGLLATGDLTVAGPITGGTTASLAAADGGLVFEATATVAAPNLTLSGTGPITFASGAVLGQAGATIDIATITGNITQDTSARLIGETLRITTTGAGDVTLSGTGNAVAVLGDVSLAAGDFVLVNTSQPLSVEGSVSAIGVDVNAGGLAISGAIAASGDMRLASTGTLVNAGTITAAGAMTLMADSGQISLGGVVHAGGALGVTAGNGSIVLTGAIGTDAGDITLAATGDLLQTGGTLASGGTLGVTTGGGITLAGVTEVAGLADLDAMGGIVVSGTLTAGMGIDLIAGGDIAVTGDVRAGTSVVLAAGGSILSSGTVAAVSTSIVALANGEIRQSAGLFEAAEAINMTASGSAGFVLTLDGTVTAGVGLSGFAGSGSISLGGVITTGTLGASFILGGDFRQTGGTLTVPVALSVTAPGSILQSAGTINALTLALNAVGGDLTQAAAGSLLSADTGGRIDLNAGRTMSLAGQLHAVDPLVGDVGLRAVGGGAGATLTQDGTILAGRSITQTVVAGDIVHGGTAIADTVTFLALPGNWTQSSGLIQARVSPFALTVAGSATQSTQGTIAAPGSIGVSAGTGIAQAGTLTTPNGEAALLTQAGSLAASGTITAGQVRFTNPAGLIDVSGLITGLTPAAMQQDSQFAVRDADFPTPAEQAGVFVTTGAIGQSISFTADIAATTGRGQLLVTIPNDAKLALAVDSRNADLFLSLGTGSATGVLHVGSFHLRYPGQGTSETVDFAGTVNDLSGFTAASAAFILPTLKPNYQLNGCAIQSVACFQISDLRVPVSNPLKDVQTGGSVGGAGVQFILPDVAERDY